MKKLQDNRKQIILFILASLAVAVLSHAYFIYAYYNDRYMLGINDGLSQMIPFKKLLYEQYREGNFFYSNQFGMGGGVYSQLGYYYSNSIVFYITSICLFVLEKLRLISQPDFYTWIQLILPISIIRQTVIILCAIMYFRHFKLSNLAAFCGAVIYGTSAMYFRHVTYWEFFADAMIWLPLLLLGMERIIKNGKSGLFIFAVAITLFDNFYFAYIHCVVMAIYLVFRWAIPIFENEISKWNQLKKMISGGIIGLLISAVSFIPAVYGYVNNHRIAYDKPIAFIGMIDHPILYSRIILIPAFVLICFFIFTFYKIKMFRFFAAISIFCMALHFSPKVASMFNGFSAPQYRWEYFLSLMLGGVVAFGLDHIGQVVKKKRIIAISISMALYLSTMMIGYFVWHDKQLVMVMALVTLISAVITMAFCFTHEKKQAMILIFLSVVMSSFYQKEILSELGNVKNTTKQLIHSDAYNGKEQLELLDFIKKREANNDEFYRIDWMVEGRNNTPIVQDFNGFSIYSSILNKHLLYWYLYDLEIDMKSESVSRYMTLGDRANLLSILSGKYIITEKDQSTVPYGFKEVHSIGDYVAYENEYLLPFLRATNTVYLEEELNDRTILEREHAMLEGMIVGQGEQTQELKKEEINLIDQTEIMFMDANYHNDLLEVKEKEGGFDIHLPEKLDRAGDVYLSFYIERKDINKQYKIKINDYQTIRKKNSSIYKTGVKDLTIRVKAEDVISLRLPKGKYEFRDLELYYENYHVLESTIEEMKNERSPSVRWDNNQILIEYENDNNKQFGVIPVPYEEGWEVYVNGEKTELIQANYSFIGMKLDPGVNEIYLRYTPPYFKSGLFVSLLTLSVVILFTWIKRRKNNSMLRVETE